MIAQNSYIKFLSALHDLEHESAERGLDLEGEKLLGYISVQYAKGLTLTVTECMRIKNVASPATIHRKISDLLEKGWIETVFDGENRRTKYLAPTSKAIKHYERVSKLMLKALK
jgi:SOS-response transcriptional repressor LexA